MAARLNPRHQEMVKAKIRGSQLINRLQNHALAKKSDMTESQVSAAKILLAKIISDAPKVVEGDMRHTGNVTITLGFGSDG